MTGRILRLRARTLSAALALSLAASVSACATGHVGTGDKLAKQGKWEEALVEYKAAEKQASTNRVLKRIAKAEKHLAAAWVKKGIEAAKADAMAEAAEWWKQASDLRPDDRGPGSARVVIAEHTAKLETCGESSVKAKKWENAFRCYEALRIAYPDRFDLQEKVERAHKMFAHELDRDAQGLAKKGLTGAALVLSMRSRAHDPLQDGAFERESQYRKQVAMASLVNVDAVTLDDRGFWGLGAYLEPALTRRLGEYPPYGPTKVAAAQQAVFLVTIEDFAWWDDAVHTLTSKEIQDAKAEGKEKVPNPEHAARKALVAKLEKELKAMEAAAGKAEPAKDADAAPTKPAPKKTAKAGKGKAASKGKAAAKPESKPDEKRTPAPRPPTDEQIAEKRKQLDEAKTKLAATEETVAPLAAASRVWHLSTEVTRTVQARVRFELREPDFAEPVVKTLTFDATAKDVTRAADAAHGIEADALELPTVEELVQQLAEKYAGPGTETLEEARTRRAERWIERGRQARNAGQEDEALDLYVRALFARGAEGLSLPGDAATVVAVRLENGTFKDIVAGP